MIQISSLLAGLLAWQPLIFYVLQRLNFCLFFCHVALMMVKYGVEEPAVNAVVGVWDPTKYGNVSFA